MVMDALLQGGLAFACQYALEHNQGTIFRSVRWIFLGTFGVTLFMLLISFWCGLHRWNLAIMRLYGWLRLSVGIFFFFVGLGYLIARYVMNFVEWPYMKSDDVRTHWNKTFIILGYFVGGCLGTTGLLTILTTACYRFGRLDARVEYEVQRLLGA